MKSAFEQVTRQMVLGIQKDIENMSGKLDKLDSKVTELFNHQSNRLPLWVSLVMAFLFSLATGLIVAMVK